MCDADKSGVVPRHAQSKRIYFFRQLLVSSGGWVCYFMLGLVTGAPTVLVPQLRKEDNSTDAITEAQASWLTVMHVYGAIPWDIFIPVLMYFWGRKITYIITCVPNLIGFILYFCSTEIIHIMISEVFLGAVQSSVQNVIIVMITECTSVEWRGVFLTIKSATFFWGVLVSNSIGTFLHWKYIPLVGILCAAYTLLTVYFWPESPLYLASKGRYEESVKSHRWLKGSGENEEKELQKLLTDNQILKTNLSLKAQLTNIIKLLPRREFYLPVFMSFVLILLYMFSGKLACTVYAVEILKKVTNDTSTAYICMLLLDVITLVAMYSGCAVVKRFKRRPMLFTCTICAIIFLLALTLYLFLEKKGLISQNNYIAISLLMGYSVAIGCGPMIMTTSIVGELIPIEGRNFSLFILVVMIRQMHGAYLKIIPLCFSIMDSSSIFLMFCVGSTILLAIIYRYLPETKDKTLQEIADLMKVDRAPTTDEAKEFLPVYQNKTR